MLGLMAFGSARAACPPEGGNLTPVVGDQTRLAVAGHVVQDGWNGIATLYAVWLDGRDPASSGDIWMSSSLACVQDDPSGGRPIGVGPSRQDAPAIASTGFTNFLPNPPGDTPTFASIIAWQDDRNGDFDVYARRAGLVPFGAWDTLAVPVCVAPGDQTDVSVAGDTRHGAATFAWVDRRNGEQDLYAARLDSTGAPSWDADGVPVCLASGVQSDLRSFGVGEDETVVVWLDARSTPTLYAVRLTASGAVAPGWSPDGIRVGGVVGDALPYRAGVDGQGNLFVTWTDVREDPVGDIYAQKLLPDGSIAPGWPADGVAVSTGSAGARAGDVAPDDPTYGAQTGGAYVVWEDDRNDPTPSTGNTDVFALRLDANGSPAPGWPATGAPLCTDPSRQDHVRAVSTVAFDGVLAVWADARDPTSGPDLMASKLAPDGSIPSGWNVDGNHVTTGPDVQDLPQLVADSQGGARIAWIDWRNRATQGADVWATNINTQGVSDVPAPLTSRPAVIGPWPTPTHARATLELRLLRPSRVSATIVDLSGRLVRRLVEDERPAGTSRLEWDGRERSGRRAVAGVYWFRVVMESGTDSRPVVLLP